MASEAKEYASNKLIEAIAEHLQDAVVEMVGHASEFGDTEFVAAIAEALDLEPEDHSVDANKLAAALQRAEAAEARATTAEKRRVEDYDYLVKVMRKYGLETERSGDLSTIGHDLLVAMFASALREAQQQLTELRESTQDALAELAKISTNQHPDYVMRADVGERILPGDVVYRMVDFNMPSPDSIVRVGEEMRRADHDERYLHSWHPIYRRLDSPAAPVKEAAEGEKPGERVPQAAVDTLLRVLESRITHLDSDEYDSIAKTAALLRNGIIELRYMAQPIATTIFDGGEQEVERAKGTRYVSQGGRLYAVTTNYTALLGQFFAHIAGDPQSDLNTSDACAAYLNGTSPEHAELKRLEAEVIAASGLPTDGRPVTTVLAMQALREQAAEIERLKADKRELLEKLLAATCPFDQPKHAWNSRESVLDVLEAVGASRQMWENDLWRESIKKGEAALAKHLAAPSQPAKPEHHGKPAAPAPAAESGKVEWVRGAGRVRQGSVAEFVIIRDAGPPVQETIDEAIAWLNRRAEVEAQLAAYKRDAEAWEKFHKYRMAFYVGPETMHGPGVSAWVASKGRHMRAIGNTRVDAILALAKQIEVAAQLTEQKGEGN